LAHPSLIGRDITEGRIPSKRPSGRPRQKTLHWIIKRMAALRKKLSGQKNGESCAQNLPLSREP